MRRFLQGYFEDLYLSLAQRWPERFDPADAQLTSSATSGMLA